MAGLVALALAALAVLEAARWVVLARRTRRLNCALHELRRPLQGMSLALGARAPNRNCALACLEQASGALEGLDLTINGARHSAPRTLARTALAEIVDSLERRWRFAPVEVEAPATSVALDADPVRLGAALDNLVSNALRHGRAPVRVRALTTSGTARLEVRDGGPGGQAVTRPGDPRHGHGLRVAGEIAAHHGGTVIGPGRTATGETVAALSLPALGRDPSS